MPERPTLPPTEAIVRFRGVNPMPRSWLMIGAATAAIALLAPVPVKAQESADQQLGNVHFETSCSEVAQRRFDRAMRYQHSFWYRASREIFEDVLKADPG